MGDIIWPEQGAYPNPFGRVPDGVVPPPLRHVVLKCFNCEQLGHHKRDCPHPKKSDRTRHLRCNRCGILGHPHRQCPSHNEWILKTMDIPSKLGKLKCLDMSHKVAKIWDVNRDDFYDFKKCMLNAFQKTHKTRGAVVMTLPWHEDFPYVAKWTNEKATYTTQFYSKIEDGVYLAKEWQKTKSTMLTYEKYGAEAYLNKVGNGNLERDPNCLHTALDAFENMLTTGDFPKYVVAHDDTTRFPVGSTNDWHMTALKSTFAEIQVNPTHEIKGINTPQLLIGQVYSYTPFHVEDENFASLNFLHKGAPKIWIALPEYSRTSAEKLFEKLYPESYRTCRAAHLHKNFLTFPQVLQMADPPIPFEIIWQYPGDCVATWPGAYHMVINLGNNTAEATNFTLPLLTDKFCGKPSTCNCYIREEIDNLRAKFKFQQPGRDEPEPLSQPSDAQPGPSGNASAASAADIAGGEVCATEPLSQPSDAQPGPSGNASAASAADIGGGESSSLGSRGGRGRGHPRARARASGRGPRRAEDQVAPSTPPVGMSENISARLRPRTAQNYQVIFESDSE